MSEKKHRLTRRNFIKNSALGIAAVSTPTLLTSCAKSEVETGMPMRVLGKTGLEVSVLSFGGGSQFVKNQDGVWERMLERALEVGINYFDTATEYAYKGSKLHSEERFGEILSTSAYRDKVIISTKFNSRDEDGMMKEFEESLDRLKTDYVDVIGIHSIERDEDIAAIESGVYKRMLQLKDSGAARFVGFSCMNSSEKSKELIEKLDPDVAILAMNPTQYGDFAKVALPSARAKNTGTIAMKVLRNLVGKNGTTAKELITYAVTQQGVASAVIGHVGMETFEENVRLVKEIMSNPTALAQFDRKILEKRLAQFSGPHALCWARSDYRDDGNWA
jgi:aryl-alcohol dehydrogenase-like predicted oxidoreductase